MNELFANDTLSTIWLCLLAASIIGGLTGWFLRGSAKNKIVSLNNEWSERYSDLEMELDKYKTTQPNKAAINFNDDTENPNAELVKKYKFLLTRTATLEKTVHKSKEALKDNQKKLQHAEDELVSLRDINNNASSNIQPLMQNAAEDKQNIEKIKELEDKIHNLSTALNDNDQQFDHTKQDLDDQKQENTQLAKQLTEKDSLIDTLQNQLHKVELEMANKSNEPAAIDEDSIRLKKQMAERQADIELLKGRIDDKDENINKLNLKIDELNAQYQRDIEDKTHRLNETKKQLDTSNDYLEKAKSAIALLEGYVKDESNEKTLLQEEMGSHKAKAQGIEDRFLSIEKELEDKNQLIKQLTVDLQSKIDQNDMINTDLAKTKLKLNQSAKLMASQEENISNELKERDRLIEKLNQSAKLMANKEENITNELKERDHLIEKLNQQQNNTHKELLETKELLENKEILASQQWPQQNNFDMTKATVKSLESYVDKNRFKEHNNAEQPNDKLATDNNTQTLEDKVKQLQEQLEQKDDQLKDSIRQLDEAKPAVSNNSITKASLNLLNEAKQAITNSEDDTAKLSKDKPRIKVGIQKSGIIDMTPSSPLGRLDNEKDK